jgi:hypothetical protein
MMASEFPTAKKKRSFEPFHSYLKTNCVHFRREHEVRENYASCLLLGRIGHIEPGVKGEVQDFPMHPECQIGSKITLVKGRDLTLVIGKYIQMGS